MSEVELERATIPAVWTFLGGVAVGLVVGGLVCVRVLVRWFFGASPSAERFRALVVEAWPQGFVATPAPQPPADLSRPAGLASAVGETARPYPDDDREWAPLLIPLSEGQCAALQQAGPVFVAVAPDEHPAQIAVEEVTTNVAPRDAWTELVRLLTQASTVERRAALQLVRRRSKARPESVH